MIILVYYPSPDKLLVALLTLVGAVSTRCRACCGIDAPEQPLCSTAMIEAMSSPCYVLMLKGKDSLSSRRCYVVAPVYDDLRLLARVMPRLTSTVRPSIVTRRYQGGHQNALHVVYASAPMLYLCLHVVCHCKEAIPPRQSCSTSTPRWHTTPLHCHITNQTTTSTLLQLLRKRKKIDEKI